MMIVDGMVHDNQYYVGQYYVGADAFPGVTRLNRARQQA